MVGRCYDDGCDRFIDSIKIPKVSTLQVMKKKQEGRVQNSFFQNVLTQIIRPKEWLWYEAWFSGMYSHCLHAFRYMMFHPCKQPGSHSFPVLWQKASDTACEITPVRTKAVFPYLQSNKGSKQINMNILGNSGGDISCHLTPRLLIQFPLKCFILFQGEERIEFL